MSFFSQVRSIFLPVSFTILLHTISDDHYPLNRSDCPLRRIMYLSASMEGAPNKPKTPLDDRRCRSWPRTKAENDQLFMFIILGILISFSFYNICIYLNDRRQKRRQERRRRQREAEMDEEAEREEIEQRRNRVIAWIEVTETGQ